MGRRALVLGDVQPVGRALEVLHAPVETVLTDESSDGHQVGDLRTASIATTDASGEPLGRLDATLTTTAVDVPAPGDEIRISTLVFSFGESGTDQIVVGGSAVYPAQGSTLAVGSVTTRPIQGGSGRFAGVTGSAVSEHLADGSWRHTLYLQHGVAVMRVVDAPEPRAMTRPDARKVTRPGARRMRSHDDGVRGLERAAAVLRAWIAHLDRDGRDDRAVGRGSRPDDACRVLRPAERPRPDRDAGPSGESAAIVRESLGSTQPASAAGQELGLWHYTIPPGSVLEPHTHAGPQIARVARGELEYTIISGEGTMIAADGTSTPVGPGTYILHAGDTIIESPGMEHFGANRGRRPAELIAATLYPEGAPLAIPLAPVPSIVPFSAESSPAGAASPAPASSPAA